MDEWMNRIETKLDNLANPQKTDIEIIRRLLIAFKAGKLIESVKEVRAITGVGLKEAKDLIDDCR